MKRRKPEQVIECRDDHSVIHIDSAHGVFAAMIDNDDVERIKANRWWILKNPRGGPNSLFYVITKGNRLLHRFILGVNGRFHHVAHINNNPMDNRKANLVATSPRGNLSMGMRGVAPKGWSLSTRGGSKPYRVLIRFGGRQRCIGCVATQEEAENIYRFATRTLLECEVIL